MRNILIAQQLTFYHDWLSIEQGGLHAAPSPPPREVLKTHSITIVAAKQSPRGLRFP